MIRKQSSKKKNQPGRSLSSLSQGKSGENSPKATDEDTAMFIAMSQELKDEGNRLFQRRDYAGAMLNYEKAIKLLPRTHIDVAYLRSNMAACYMQLGLSEYPRAINECNLALEVEPKYSKALLKRARCYEGLNRLDLALRDTNSVLQLEPNNLMASEIGERVKASLQERGLTVKDDASIELPPDYVEPPIIALKAAKKFRERAQRKRKGKKASPSHGDKGNQVPASNIEEKSDEKKTQDKLVVEEQIMKVDEAVSKRNVKLVLGEDIRVAQLPVNCSLLYLREIIHDRFPSSHAVLIKYRDREDDLVTITSDEELRWAEASAESQGSIRLYVVEVSAHQDPFFGKLSAHTKEGIENQKFELESNTFSENGDFAKAKELEKHPTCIEDWIVHFAQLFKSHAGLDSDDYLDLHELGMKVYSEAMEETVTSEEAQSLFGMAAEKFQEMAALALFNWGNVHMSRVRKGVYKDDSDDSSLLKRIKDTYELAQVEYKTAGTRYKESLKIKPDFYEAQLALGQNLFERARLSWYFAIGNNVDFENWPSSSEVIDLYNRAEDSMERGMQMWEESVERKKSEISRPSSTKLQIKKLGLEELLDNVSEGQALASERTSSARKHINLFWGTMLYERSIVKFKLGLPVWHECLEVAVEKFTQAGASETDIAVMLKNHCSNDSTVEGLGFRIDEIVHAWNEMSEAKQWKSRVPSFRLEPLLRRRIPRLCQALENAQLQ